MSAPVEHKRPFFAMLYRGGPGLHVELRGTWLPRQKPHVMPAHPLLGVGYWVAVYRGQTAFHRDPSEAARRVIAKVETKRHGDTYALPSAHA